MGPLPRADTTTLGAYLGSADLTAIGDAAALAAAAAAEDQLSPASRAAGVDVFVGWCLCAIVDMCVVACA